MRTTAAAAATTNLFVMVCWVQNLGSENVHGAFLFQPTIRPRRALDVGGYPPPHDRGQLSSKNVNNGTTEEDDQADAADKTSYAAPSGDDQHQLSSACTNRDIPTTTTPKPRRRSADFPQFCYNPLPTFSNEASARKKQQPGRVPLSSSSSSTQWKVRINGGPPKNYFVSTSTAATASSSSSSSSLPQPFVPRTGSFPDAAVPKSKSAPSSSAAPTTTAPLPRRRRISIPENRQFTEPAMESVEQAAVRTRLLLERTYAREDAFQLENLYQPPNLQDLASTRKPTVFELFWIGLPASLLYLGGAYWIFPYLITALDQFVTMSPDQLDNIVSKFGPGVSILYGTFISLTLSILYQRQRAIQEVVATETSLMVVLLRSLLSLFRDDPDRLIDVGQSMADQIRTLVRSSRGAELMLLMYSDPYARILEQVDHYELQEPTLSSETRGRQASLIASCRDHLWDLMRYRATRLSDEALALPPTHYLILNILTCLILLAYCLNILPTINRIGEPPMESSLIFGLLTTTYILFFNFARDLNNPFRGVYQIRRSTAASHLLAAKWLIVNHPVLQEAKIDFEEVDESAEGVLIQSPGIGDCWFERDELFIDEDVEEEE